ncbi:MAG: FAD:protein FMN transferase [Planctomycetaceae bacterium]|nr:FAD:protein FMN transferase [Planctomycetaceae bacterium]
MPTRFRQSNKTYPYMDKPNRQPSRRDLLGARLPGDADRQENSAEEPKFGPLFHFSANAMGCEFQVLCTSEGRKALATAVTDGFDLIQYLEQQLSIYRPSSELSQINRSAFSEPISVEPALFSLLQLANEICEITEGAFDVTATPLTRLWKSHRQTRSLPSQTEIIECLRCVGSQHLIFDSTANTLRFEMEGMTIDLGGIGKGYALDRLNEHLQSAGCTDFLIHGGQSSVISTGQRSDRSGNQKHPWQIAVTHPLLAKQTLATLHLQDQAIGTSGSGRQNFVVDGKRYGHIIDPRNGWPADNLLSVTVIAKSAVLADALATAIFVAGQPSANAICNHFNVAAILISNAGKIIETINMPDENIRLA